ncbi:chalcone isomerase family protein [Congregibacter sp.]|uniref:chalcone isomerase family protein n=1 Tax=Congregibacter sp. TaxID=2744308 RepID=UPI003F6C4BD8
MCLVAALFNPLRVAGASSAEPPATLSTRSDGTNYNLRYTGRAERVFLFLKIYEIAHYAARADGAALSFETVITDQRPKAILIRFERKLGRDRIREELAKSLRKNAQENWLEDAGASVDAFMAAIDRDANAGDQLVFYWLPEGKLMVEFNGEPSFETKDLAFAKLIWSIWFGDDPACEREGLLAQAASAPVMASGH